MAPRYLYSSEHVKNTDGSTEREWRLFSSSFHPSCGLELRGEVYTVFVELLSQENI